MTIPIVYSQKLWTYISPPAVQYKGTNISQNGLCLESMQTLYIILKKKSTGGCATFPQKHWTSPTGKYPHDICFWFFTPGQWWQRRPSDFPSISPSAGWTNRPGWLRSRWALLRPSSTGVPEPRWSRQAGTKDQPWKIFTMGFNKC